MDTQMMEPVPPRPRGLGWLARGVAVLALACVGIGGGWTVGALTRASDPVTSGHSGGYVAAQSFTTTPQTPTRAAPRSPRSVTAFRASSPRTTRRAPASVATSTARTTATPPRTTTPGPTTGITTGVSPVASPSASTTTATPETTR